VGTFDTKHSMRSNSSSAIQALGFPPIIEPWETSYIRATTILASTVAVACVIVAASSAYYAVPYTFTTIDVPGASITSAQGINDADRSWGFFKTAGESTASSMLAVLYHH
jgi:hypothetical protein